MLLLYIKIDALDSANSFIAEVYDVKRTLNEGF